MPTNQPKYQTVDQNFHAQTTAGEIVIPLEFKTSIYRTMLRVGDGLAQVATVLEQLKLTKELAKLDDLGIKESGELADRWGDALRTYLGTEPGK